MIINQVLLVRRTSILHNVVNRVRCKLCRLQTNRRSRVQTTEQVTLHGTPICFVICLTQPIDIAFSVHHVVRSYVVLRTDLHVEVNLSLTLLTALSSHEDNTICSTSTIDSSCTSILQDIHRFDIVRVQVAQTVCTDLTVHDNQRRTCTVIACTTTESDRRCRTGKTRSLLNLHTRNSTHQCLRRVTIRTYRQSFFAYLRYRVGQLTAFLLHAVTQYHNFFQSLSIFLQCNIQRLTIPLKFLSYITHERDFNDISLVYIRKREVTVKVGNHTIGCTFNNYRSTDNRTHCVHNSTGSCLILLYYRSTDRCSTSSRNSRSC